MEKCSVRGEELSLKSNSPTPKVGKTYKPQHLNTPPFHQTLDPPVIFISWKSSFCQKEYLVRQPRVVTFNP